MTQGCKRDANPAHFSLGVLFNTPKNRLRTKYVTAAILITALVASALLPGGIQTAQTAQPTCSDDEVLQLTAEVGRFTAKVGRPPSSTKKDANGWTDLHYAAALNLTSLAKCLLLLQPNAKVDPKLKSDNKPLTDELKKILHQFGKNYDDWNRGGETPLHISAKENARETAALLIEKGADVNAETDDRRTPLHIAAKENAHETAALLIEKGADVNAETDDRRTPLHIAVQENARDIAALLIEKGAEVDAKDNDGNTPLAVALEYNADEIMALLHFTTEVGRPFSPMAKDANDWTDLHYAAALNFTFLAKSLLQSDAEVNARLKLDGKPFTDKLKVTLRRFKKDYDDWNRDRETPLHFAAKENAYETAALLIEKGAEVNAETFYKEWTPLHFAAKEDARKTAAMLLKKGAAVNAKTFDEEWTPLHFAAKENYHETAALLLKNGAEVNAKTFYTEWTPLHFAAKEDARDTAALLLKNDAAVNAKSDDGKTPLAVALEYSADKTADLLRHCHLADEIAQFATEVRRLPSPTEKDDNDWTDLHYAAALNLPFLAKYLLQSDAKADAELKSKERLRRFEKDYDDCRLRETPLYIVAKENTHETAAPLLEKDAVVDAKNKDGETTPLHIAAKENAHETAALLLEKGAAVNAENKDKETPLHFAAWKNAHAVAELLLNKGADVNARSKDGDTPLDLAVGKTAALLRSHGGRSGH